MKELSRFELATVKRTAQNVKGLRAKKAKLEAQLAKVTVELETINAAIDGFEAPIITLTGGFTSEQVLAGAMEAVPGEAAPAPEATTATETTVEEPETNGVNEAVAAEEAPQAENPFFGGSEGPLPFEA